VLKLLNNFTYDLSENKAIVELLPWVKE